ncbi:hypothetical protein OHB04_24365 [Streptomyces sp. NBC_01775]|uniref:hypothetical protein n=1 Tax=Streptomyces sp. NBC_01775 TaxID=2975939 RepID=UPI002DD9EA3F|nr:hypothetical protein [Streptomyces sp. NBC_01775]WSB78590.1 hypothetical protein OHB04_24365 [Streptomyces sp. NBC_01775]
MSVDPQSPGRQKRRRDAAASLDFDDPLSRPSSDDTDQGWGEGTGGAGGEESDLARFLAEKPPHHI